MREGCGKVFVNEFGFQGRTKGRERRKQKGRGGLRVLLRVKAEAGREKKGGGNERQKRTRTRKGERRASDKSRVKGREKEIWIASVCIDRRPTQELEPLWHRYRKRDEMGPGEKFANKKPEMQKVNCGNAFWKGL